MLAKRSPIQVVTARRAAWLWWSPEPRTDHAATSFGRLFLYILRRWIGIQCQNNSIHCLLFFLTRKMNENLILPYESENAFSPSAPSLRYNEPWGFKWKTWGKISSRYRRNGATLSRTVRFKHDGCFLLYIKKGKPGKMKEVQRKSIAPVIWRQKSAKTTMNMRQIYQRHFDVRYFVVKSQTWDYSYSQHCARQVFSNISMRNKILRDRHWFFKSRRKINLKCCYFDAGLLFSTLKYVRTRKSRKSAFLHF